MNTPSSRRIRMTIHEETDSRAYTIRYPAHLTQAMAVAQVLRVHEPELPLDVRITFEELPTKRKRKRKPR